MANNNLHSVSTNSDANAPAEIKSNKVITFENKDMKLKEYNPIIKHLNKDSVDIVDEQSGDFNTICGKNGIARPHYDEIKKIITDFQHIKISNYDVSDDEQNFKLGIPNRKTTNIESIENSRNFSNAMAFAMNEIKQQYSRKCVFANVDFTVTLAEDEKENEDGRVTYKPITDKTSFTINDESLGYYLYHKLFKNRLLFSEVDSETKKPFYYYDSKKRSWKRKVGESIINAEIKNNARRICESLGFSPSDKSFTFSRVKETALVDIGIVEDGNDDIDLLEQFSQAFPNFVQFGDLIYDMKEHKVAKAQPFFKLKHYHNYRIPTGLTNEEIDNLPINEELNQFPLLDKFVNHDVIDNDNNDDVKVFSNGFYENMLDDDNEFTRQVKNLFVDCKISKQELEEKADIFIRRVKENFHEDDVEFLLSILGNLFYHSNDWGITAFVLGDAGIGKSKVFNMFGTEIIQRHNLSSLKQRRIDEGSRFIESAMYGKEFNLIGELKGKNLTSNMIEFIKTTLSDETQFENKGEALRTSKFYCKIIALGNVGQLPKISTGDATDAGLRRRIVLFKCLSYSECKSKDFAKDYPENELLKVKSHFALLCMMTFNKHLQNGDIQKFQKSGGCTQRVIEGFTSKRLVESTQNYFKAHDRFRKFMCEFADKYRYHLTQKTGIDKASFLNNSEDFKDWLSKQSSASIKSFFIKWYSDEYPPTGMTKEKLVTYLNDEHNIQEKVHKFKIVSTNGKSKTKTVRGFGMDFAELVDSVITEDMPSLNVNENMNPISEFDSENYYNLD